MNRILGIYGAGGLGREVRELAADIDRAGPRWSRVLFIDDNAGTDRINRTDVCSFEDFRRRFPAVGAELVIAVGEPFVRCALREKVQAAGYGLAVLAHPAAKVASDAVLEPGAIVCYNCFVSNAVRIGENALLQPLSTVGHDSAVGQDSVLSSLVAVAGRCVIGARTYVGMSVPIREHTSVGAETIVGMGSAVLRDLPDGVVALGNPARVMKNNESHRVF